MRQKLLREREREREMNFGEVRGSKLWLGQRRKVKGSVVVLLGVCEFKNYEIDEKKTSVGV